MACHAGPNLEEDGLVLCLDAGNAKSYPGSGTIWKDLSSNKKDWSWNNVWTHNSFEGSFNINSESNYGGRSGTDYASITDGTFVIWFKTTDAQSLFLSDNLGAYEQYLGAYKVDNKYYNNLNSGTPTLHKNTTTISNLYDDIRSGDWMMLEFKGIDFSLWGSIYLNGYSGSFFRFDTSTHVSILQIYNRQLSSEESLQNYNALKGRFGL